MAGNNNMMQTLFILKAGLAQRLGDCVSRTGEWDGRQDIHEWSPITMRGVDA